MTHRPRERVAALCMFLIGTTLAVVGAPVVSAGTWTPPGYVRSFGQRGEAGVYAWGMAYNPVSDEVLAGDYWNFKVRRYDSDGNVLGQFFRGTDIRRGQPYSISVDERPGEGDIYVSEISGGGGTIGYFARYSASGTYLGEFNTGARYTAWHTISDGLLYVADSHYWNLTSSNPSKIRVYDLDDGFQQIRSFGTYGTTLNTGQMGNIHGLAVDAAGRIYAADATNRVVHVYSQTGTFLYDFGGPGTAGTVGKFSGDLRGMAIDRASGAIYVVDSNQAQIEKFQMAADPATQPPVAVDHWGSEGTGPGQMGDGGRGVAIDGQGNVWVADYGNYRMLKYSPSGTVLGTYPDPAMPPPAAGFSWARDVAVDPQGDVWGADARNNRFMQFSPTGAFLGMWGRRNSNPPYGMDYPRGIGVNPANGDVWVASTRDHFIRVYDAAGNYLGTAGNGLDSSNPGSFRWPLDIEFAQQGGQMYVWIADYQSSRVKRIDAAAPFIERQSISVTNNGVAVDVAADRLYVLSWRNDDVRVYDLNGNYLSRFGSAGSGTCQFQNPWDIDLLNGTLYVTDSERSKVMAFSTSGSCLGEWGSKGSGPYQFKDPSGITHDAAGNLYIADANNDRIVQYSFSTSLPSGDSTLPQVGLTTPTAGQTFPAETVTVTGTASDDVGIGSVYTAVRDRTSSLWWNAKEAIWGTQKTWNYAAVTSPSVTSVTWLSSFVGVKYGGSYQVQAKATDTTGNERLGTLTNFQSAGAPSGDATPPTLTVTSPSNDAVMPVGAVTIGGQATDDASVATVEVAIRNRTTGQWWQPGTGQWGANLKWFSVTLANPGAVSTAWSTTWSDGVAGGSYRAQARATDASGNVSASPFPARQWTVA